MPKISYLISSYNGHPYLHGKLHNLLEEQSEKDIEAIVLNPASPGADKAIAEAWVAKDKRTKYIELAARNNYGEAWLDMWRMASSPIVCNSNVDDRLSPSFTAIMYDRLINALPFRTKGFAYSDMVVMNTANQLIGRANRPSFNREQMSYECQAGPAVAWLNTDDFRKEVKWDLMYKRAKRYVSAFDYWLWLYFISLGFSGLSLQDPNAIVYYLQRPDSIEHQNYGGVSTYESLCSIAEFFPHHFKSRLQMFDEFSNFPMVPERQSWVESRLANRKWQGKCWENING
jgi:glycosyltransferase involved in cell wall biosynthesis